MVIPNKGWPLNTIVFPDIAPLTGRMQDCLQAEMPPLCLTLVLSAAFPRPPEVGKPVVQDLAEEGSPGFSPRNVLSGFQQGPHAVISTVLAHGTSRGLGFYGPVGSEAVCSPGFKHLGSSGDGSVGSQVILISKFFSLVSCCLSQQLLELSIVLDDLLLSKPRSQGSSAI